MPPWAISFGAPTAPVTLIELYDLHCIYCALAHERLDPLYRQLLAEGALRLVFAAPGRPGGPPAPALRLQATG